MKHVKKSVTLFVLLFTLIFHYEGYAQQSIDIDNFHISSNTKSELSSSRLARLEDVGFDLKDALIDNLRNKGYDLRLPRKSKINLERVDLFNVKVDYDTDADLVIFGKLIQQDEDITIKTYLYKTNKGIKASHSPEKVNTINGKISDWNDSDEISEAVNRIVADLFSGKQAPVEKNPVVTKTDPEPKVQDPPKTKPKKPKKEPKVKPPKTPKPPKEKPDNIAKTSKAPAIAVLGAGALMGGTGIMLRSKALRIYNDEYKGDLSDLGLLEKARKPNRQAHIIGAAGILTAGVGILIWAKRAKNSNLSSHKTDKPDIRRVQITPQIEYNAISNTNTIHAKMTYRF